jgi:two-component system, cell cycle sensor histidine kinase and response regulator CckA
MQTENTKTVLAGGKNTCWEAGVGKILFVDDEVGLVNVFVKVLQSVGYEAVGLSDPKKALVTFLENSNSFDAVITDQIMPELFGDALAIQILKVRPDIPIFLCSGFTSKMNNEECTKIGIREFFPKPISMTDLLPALKAAISSNTASR